MKSPALPPRYQIARPKKLRFVLSHLAGRITEHAGQLTLRLGHTAQQLAQRSGARRSLLELCPALS